MPLSSGANFGPYRVIDQLGKGGMASVYRVYEPGLDRHVALKVLPAEFLHDDTFAARFAREAKVIARLEHPNIVPIYSSGIEAGVPWMAMRLVPGGTLSAQIAKERLPIARSVQILRGIADALTYAHGQGVIHRDLKPQNVLLDQAGNVYLADFGIARIVEGSTVLTRTGMVTGTPQYMAPEQALAQPMDHRVDVYALGIVAYELFTGSVPFHADTPMAVLMKHLRDPIPLPPLRQLPERLQTAVLKALAKERDDRWPSAAAFVEALERGVSGASSENDKATVPPRASAPEPPTLETPPASRPVPSPAAPPPQTTLQTPLASSEPSAAPPPVRRGRGAGYLAAVGALAVAAVGIPVLLVMRQMRPSVTPLPVTPTPAVVLPIPRVVSHATLVAEAGAAATAAATSSLVERYGQAWAPQVTPAPAAGRPIIGKDGLEYVKIPAGGFEMGCVPGDDLDLRPDKSADSPYCDTEEKPRHHVELTKAFAMGRTLVTVVAYSKYASATGRSMPPAPEFPQEEDHPIVDVTWDDASSFCSWIGGRLPTEAEWEYAARGGKDGLRYPWGDDLTHERANYGSDTILNLNGLASGRDRWVKTSPVGSFDANGFGLYDMSGNVWEWCRDGYAEGYYKVSPSRDPSGVPGANARAIRGGAYYITPNEMRTSFRRSLPPDTRTDTVGFRCARDVR